MALLPHYLFKIHPSTYANGTQVATFSPGGAESFFCYETIVIGAKNCQDQKEIFHAISTTNNEAKIFFEFYGDPNNALKFLEYK